MRLIKPREMKANKDVSLTKTRGHGTYVDNEEVIASVAGIVERVNKLISVRAIRTRSVGLVVSAVIVSCIR